jgi:hypothetical protein
MPPRKKRGVPSKAKQPLESPIAKVPATLPSAKQLADEYDAWHAYSKKLRAAIRKAKVAGYEKQLSQELAQEEYLYEEFDERRARATDSNEWVKVPSRHVPVDYVCPFTREMGDSRNTIRTACAFAWRLKGTSNVFLCSMCVPHNARFFAMPGYKALDELVLESTKPPVEDGEEEQ